MGEMESDGGGERKDEGEKTSFHETEENLNER